MSKREWTKKKLKQNQKNRNKFENRLIWKKKIKNIMNNFKEKKDKNWTFLASKKLLSHIFGSLEKKKQISKSHEAAGKKLKF